MKQFDFHRFVNVACWDLTINSRFYLRSSLLVVALCCFPILMSFLYAILEGRYTVIGQGDDDVTFYVAIISLIGCGYSIIASGYMFHNLLARQGRIGELTLPATNLEKFVWHFLVIAVGTQLVWHVGVICADLLHFFFRMGAAGPTHSITAFVSRSRFVFNPDQPRLAGHNMHPLFLLMVYCFLRTFSLVNAWKYKHNIPLTILLHFLLTNVVSLAVVIFATTCFKNIDGFERFVETLDRLNPDAVIISLYVFFILLYCGIVYLTYRLYTRAQLTTKRNP